MAVSGSVIGNYVGASVKRVEDPRFLTGQGRYIDDIMLPNMAYAAFLRSPYPHARITVDASEARALPGVMSIGSLRILVIGEFPWPKITAILRNLRPFATLSGQVNGGRRGDRVVTVEVRGDRHPADLPNLWKVLSPHR